MGVNQKTAWIVIERDKMKCQNPKCYSHYGHIHHCFQKSFYFGRDKNNPWNLILLCSTCHDHIHHLGGKKGLFLDWLCKTIAISRWQGKDLKTRREMELKIKRLKLKLDDTNTKNIEEVKK